MRALKVACACLMSAATAAAQNLLTNGSFNGNLNGWSYGGASTYDSTRDATGTPGSGSAKALAPPSTSLDSIHQCVVITSSTQYRAGGKILIPSGQAPTGLAFFYVSFFSGTDCFTGYLDSTVPPYTTTVGTWVASDTGFVTPPAAATSLSIIASLSNQASGSGNFQANFDDAFVFAGAASHACWIPAVIHKDVPSKNAKWRSDVAILNRSTSTANLTITMHLNSGPVSQTAQLAGSSQLLQTDVAGWLGVNTDSGPLEVTSDQGFFLSGRTYNQVDATHTYGQDYEGEDPGDLLATLESAWLPQLTENASYRTNIGITNTGSSTANVTVTLYDASGNQVWADSRDYAPGGFYQYQQPYLALGGIASGYAKVTVNSGWGVVAYASVTDNNTGDPTTITMKR
ncbi:MAG: hypothetical protein LAO05_13685 [Acidobacteriia bacterium]|nr:hypothetical protein [Terriglobia bacterium]